MPFASYLGEFKFQQNNELDDDDDQCRSTSFLLLLFFIRRFDDHADEFLQCVMRIKILNNLFCYCLQWNDLVCVLSLAFIIQVQGHL